MCIRMGGWVCTCDRLCAEDSDKAGVAQATETTPEHVALKELLVVLHPLCVGNRKVIFRRRFRHGRNDSRGENKEIEARAGRREIPSHASTQCRDAKRAHTRARTCLACVSVPHPLMPLVALAELPPSCVYAWVFVFKWVVGVYPCQLGAGRFAQEKSPFSAS